MEADEAASASRIAAQLPAIEKLINAKSSIKLKIELDNAKLESQAKSVAKNGIKPITDEAKLAQTELAKITKLNSLEAFWNRNTKAHSSSVLVKEYQRVYNVLSDMNTPLSLASKELSAFQSKVRAAGMTGRSFGDEMKNAFDKFSSWLGVGNVIMSVVNGIQKITDQVIALDKSLVDLQMATGDSRAETAELLKEYNSLAKELGATTTEVAASADEWLRQGKTAEETNTLIYDSMVLSKVGQLESAEATRYLTSAMKGYKVDVEDTIGIVDKLSAVDMESATSAGGLAEAMSRTANSANIAGVSMDKLLGYLATVGEVTQKDMASVGESFKTIFSRMGNIKLGKFIDDETGEDLSDVEATLSKLGISLRDSEDTFRNFGDVLDEVGTRWNTFSDVEQNSIAVAFAGVRQRENFLTLMENYGTALEYTSTAANSAGTSLEKFENYQQGVESSQKSFVASFEDLSDSVLSSDFVKGVYDTGSGILGFLTSVVDTLGTIPGLIAPIVTLFAQMKGYSVFGTKTNLDNFSGKEFTFLEGLKFGKVDTEAVERYNEALEKTGDATEAWAKAQTNAEGESKKLNKVTRDLTKSADGNAVEMEKVSAANQKVSLSSRAAALGMNLLATAGNMLLSMGISFVINGIISGIQALASASEEAREKALEAGEAYQEQVNAIEEYKLRISELKTSLEAGNLSQEEAYNARKELLSIQDEVIAKYGLEAEALNLLKQSADEANAALDGVTKSQAIQTLTENSSAFDEAVKKIESSYDTAWNFFWDDVGAHRISFNWDENVKGAEKIIEIFSKYDNLKIWESDPSKAIWEADTIVSPDQMVAGQKYTFEVTGNYKEANETVHALLEDLTELSINSGIDVDQFFKDGPFIQGIDDAFKPALEATDKVINEWGELYDQQVLTKIASNDLYSQAMNQVEEAQSAFNEALLSGDDEAVRAAMDSFNQIFSAFNFDDPNAENYIDDTGVREYFQKIIDDFNNANVEYEAKAKLKAVFTSEEDDSKAIKEEIEGAVAAFENEDGEVDVKQIVNFGLDLENGVEGLSAEQSEAYQELKARADEYGISVESLVQKLIELGYVQGTAADMAEANLARFKSQISAVTNESEAVSKALSEQSESGSLSHETIESLIAVNGDYADALEYTGRGITLNQEKLDALNESSLEATRVEIEQQRAVDVNKWAKRAAQVLQLQNSYDSLTGAQKNELASLEEETAALADAISQYDILISQIDYATSGYKKWLDARDRTDSGAVYDEAGSAYKALTEGLESGKIGTNAFEGARDFLIPQEVIDEGLDAVRNYVYEISDLFEEGVPGVEAFWERAVGAGLADRTGENSWQLKPEVSVEELAKGLNLTEDMVLATLGELEEYGFEFNFGSDAEVLQTVQKLIEAKQKLNSIPDKTSEEYRAAADELAEISNQLEQMPAEKLARFGLTIDPETEELLYNETEVAIAVSLYEKNDVQQLLSDYRRKWLELQQAIEAGVDVTGIAGELGELEAQLLDLPESVRKVYGITESTLENGIAGLPDLLTEYRSLLLEIQRLQGTDAENGEYYASLADSAKEAYDALSKISELHPELEINMGTLDEELLNGTFNLEPIQLALKADTEELETKFTSLEMRKKALEESPVKLQLDASAAEQGLSDFKTKLDGISDKTVTVTTDFRTTGVPPTISGSANAAGNSGVKKDQIALTGELGPELVVSPDSGTWRTVGEHGAEFSQLKKGDIVFDAEQTEELLKRGHIPSRGFAYAGGTISGGGTLYVPSSSGTKKKKKTTSSRRDTAAEDASKAAEDAAKAAKEAAQEELRYYQHLRKMELISDEEYYRELERIVNRYYKGNDELLDEYYSGLEELYELQKSIHQDWLGDREHQIYLLDQNYGLDSAEEQIAIYREMQASVNRAADEARARGLDEDDDYIQELQKQWWEYEENITSLYEEMADAYIEEMERITDFQESELKRQTSMWDFLFGDDPEDLEDALGQYEQMLEKGNEIIDEANRQKDRAHQGAEEKRGNIQKLMEENGITWDGSFDDLFTIEGDVNEGALDEFLKLFDHLPNAEEIKEMIRGEVYGIASDKGSWYDSEMIIRDVLSDLEAAEDDLRSREKEAISEVEEMILARKEKELDAIEEIHEKAIESLEDQLDAVNELYDRRIETLNDLKEKEDYQKNLNKETDTLNDIQAQIDKYSMIDTEAARTKVKELQKQLAEQQEKIDEMENDRHHNDLIDALEKDKEAQQDAINEQIDLENEKYEEILKLMDERYSAEAVHNEALLVLQTGYFNEFSETADMTYDSIVSGAQTSAVEAGEAFKNFCIETNGYFDEMADGPILDSIENWKELKQAIIDVGIEIDRLNDAAKPDYEPDFGNNGVDDSVEDQGAAHEANDKKLQENRDYAWSEYERTLKVIDARKRYGQDISVQEAYLKRICDILGIEVPKYHTGFLPDWIGADEKLALLKDDETVLTRGMMENFLSRLRTANFFGHAAGDLVRQSFGASVPAAAGVTSSLQINGGLIHVEGNVDGKVLPKLQRISESITYRISEGMRRSR